MTRLDKVFFPEDGIAKGDLIQYYESVAAAMIPYLRDRPLVMERYPDGITGQGVVQKNVPSYFPEWVTRAEVPKQHGGTLCQVVCDKPATLIYLANQGCIELHVFLSALGALDRPDQLVFDLDPPDAAQFGEARRTALDLRELLEGVARMVADGETANDALGKTLVARYAVQDALGDAAAVEVLVTRRAVAVASVVVGEGFGHDPLPSR